mmetsp:Transcript_28844/g.82859  ORF Transcript_28844/g.82859 Transcript_28844/m.82859 type:complete len:265 (-) Transcript_28844:567-1361(-)
MRMSQRPAATTAMRGDAAGTAAAAAAAGGAATSRFHYVDVRLEAHLQVAAARTQVGNQQLRRVFGKRLPLHVVACDNGKGARQDEWVVEDTHAVAKLLASFAQIALVHFGRPPAAAASRFPASLLLLRRLHDSPIFGFSWALTPAALLPHELAIRPSPTVERSPRVSAHRTLEGGKYFAHVHAAELVLLQGSVANRAQLHVLLPAHLSSSLILHPPAFATSTPAVAEHASGGPAGAFPLEFRELFPRELAIVGLQRFLPLAVLL